MATRGIYGRKYPPSSIPVNDLTYVLPASGDLAPNSPSDIYYMHLQISSLTLEKSFSLVFPCVLRNIVLKDLKSDVWADQDIHYPGDSWNEPSGNLYGNFKQIYLLKKQVRSNIYDMLVHCG
jgi:chitinase